MIGPNTRLSTIFSRAPSMRAVLAAWHPALARFGRPVVGRALAHTATVADAARMVGVPVEHVIEVLTLPGAAHPPEGTGPAEGQAPAWVARSPGRTLDLRASLAAGEEPFPAIMAATRTLGPGQVLALLTPFEPAPLRQVLGRRGWQSHAWFEEGTCHTRLLCPAPEEDDPDEIIDTAQALQRCWNSDLEALDLRNLPAPTPLRLVLAAVASPERLPLSVWLPQEPFLLYPRLAERGLRHTVEQRTSDGVRLRIERAPAEGAGGEDPQPSG